MTPAILPPKLYRPLAEVKSYVEKMPDGVTLTNLSNKVGSFCSLSKNDKDKLIKFLSEREGILVIQAKARAGKNMTTFLRHKKFGYPKEIPGYIYPINKPIEEIKQVESKPEQDIMEKLSIPVSPDALRKQAEQLIKAAEAAEKMASENDSFNKKLNPVKLEILQAVGAIQRKFDEMMDCVGVLEKAANKLKELKP